MYELFRRYGTALYARRAFQKCAEKARDAVDYLERKGVFGKAASVPVKRRSYGLRIK